MIYFVPTIKLCEDLTAVGAGRVEGIPERKELTDLTAANPKCMRLPELSIPFVGHVSSWKLKVRGLIQIMRRCP